MAVSVVIKPQCGSAQRIAMAESTGLSHINESSLPRILEKPVLAYARYKDVRKTVIVVIAHGHAHAIHFQIESGFMGYVGKSSIMIVVIEPQRGRLPLVAGPIHAIHK